MTDPADVVALVLATSDDAVASVREWFAAAGFAAGPASGPTLVVTGPADLYATALGARPVPAGDGGWTTAAGDELPLDRLPPTVRATVRAVALERPVELHGPPQGDGP